MDLGNVNTPIAKRVLGRSARDRAGVDWRFVGRSLVRVALAVISLAALPILATWSPILFALLGGPLVIALFLTPGLFILWAAYVLGFATFVILRTGADETAFVWHFQYPIIADRLLGLGHLPTVWLQSRMGGPAFDWSMILIYVSYFLIPPAVAIVLWLRKNAFKRFVIATLLTYAIGLAFHFTVPTAPPWLAAFEGHLPQIERILFTVAAPAAPQIHEAGYQASQNDVAAMPSMHIAVTILACLGALQIHRRFLAAALIYAFGMTLSVVYLGEHYLVDALAGAVVAVVAWFAACRLAGFTPGRSP